MLWRLFYLVEPWGFAEEEFRSARLLTMLHNMNAPKSKQKSITKFVRNMPKMVMGALHRQSTPPDAPDLDTKEGQAQATEIAVEKFKQMFGNVIDTRKK